MRKDIVLYNSNGEEVLRFNLMDVDNIEFYPNSPDNEKTVIFLDDDSYHQCSFFEIERVE